MLKPHGNSIWSCKGCVPRYKFIDDPSQCVLVPSPADFPLELLWSHIRRRTIHCGSLLKCRCIAHDSNTKVGKESIASPIEKNVFGLEIMVDDPLLVSVVQRIAYGGDNRDHLS